MFNRTDLKVESFHRHLELLMVLRGRHLAWAGETEDLAVKQKHLEITNTLEDTMRQYESLLNTCVPK